MKYLLVLIVVLIGIWVWRANRAADKANETRDTRKRAPKSAGAIEMDRCDLCGIHCPSDDLVAGKRGVYCSTQHRKQAEA